MIYSGLSVELKTIFSLFPFFGDYFLLYCFIFTSRNT